MGFRFHWKRGFLVASLLLIVAGCDSNSLGQDSAIPIVQITPPPPPVTMTVVPSLGLISGANVALTDVSGSAVEGATGQTDTSGQVQLTFSSAEVGPFVITISGATGALYFDEFLNDFVSFPEGSQLRAIIPAIQDIVGVTPLTEIAVARFVASGGATAEDVAAVNEAVRAAFLPGIADITAAPTVLTTGSDLLSDSEADIYATYLATLANLAPNAAAPALAVTIQLASDFSDGSFDTAVDGTAIEMPLFDNQSDGFNAQLNGALQSALTKFAQNTVSAASFASVLGSGFTVVDVGSGGNGNGGGDDGMGGGGMGDGGTTSPPPSSLIEGAARVASLAGEYSFIISRIFDNSDGVAENSNQALGSTLDFNISNAGVLTVTSFGVDQVVDFNDETITFREVDEKLLRAGSLRGTVNFDDGGARFAFISFKDNRITQLALDLSVKVGDSFVFSSVTAVRPLDDVEKQLFDDLSAIGKHTLSLSDAGSVDRYLCDTIDYDFEIPTEVSIQDFEGTIRRSLIPFSIVADFSLAKALPVFDESYFNVSVGDDGSRTLLTLNREFKLSAENELTVRELNSDGTQRNIFTNNAAQLASLACPTIQELTLSVTGLGSLVSADLSDGEVSLQVTISGTGSFSGLQNVFPKLSEGSTRVADSTSLTFSAPEGFDYAITLSTQAESTYCTLSDNASGSLGSMGTSVELTCTTTVVENNATCPLGGVATLITRFPTRTSGDGTGTLQLTFATADAPVVQGTDTGFIISSSGRLFIDDVVVSETPYFCPASNREIVWSDGANGIFYIMSLLPDGLFNEFNLATESNSFVGQYTDEAGDFSDLVFDLSTAQPSNGN